MEQDKAETEMRAKIVRVAPKHAVENPTCRLVVTSALTVERRDGDVQLRP